MQDGANPAVASVEFALSGVPIATIQPFSDGGYSASLDYGIYSLNASALGYDGGLVNNITVGAGTYVVPPIVLSVAPALVTVQVTDAATAPVQGAAIFRNENLTPTSRLCASDGGSDCAFIYTWQSNPLPTYIAPAVLPRLVTRFVIPPSVGPRVLTASVPVVDQFADYDLSNQQFTNSLSIPSGRGSMPGVRFRPSRPSLNGVALLLTCFVGGTIDYNTFAQNLSLRLYSDNGSGSLGTLIGQAQCVWGGVSATPTQPFGGGYLVYGDSSIRCSFTSPVTVSVGVSYVAALDAAQSCSNGQARYGTGPSSGNSDGVVVNDGAGTYATGASRIVFRSY